MPANTPIYNFPYPLGTDPVSQGDNDIRALAEDVETVIDNTQSQIGLWKVASVTLSGSSVSIDNCFTNDYKNYKIVLSGVLTSGAAQAFYRVRASGSDANTNIYRWAYNGLLSSGSTSNSVDAGSTIGFFGVNIGTTIHACLEFNIYNPAQPIITGGTGVAQSFDGAWLFRHGGCAVGTSVSYDGITFLTNSAVTFSAGIATIYGIRD
jgi:hypothetical protein